MKAGSLLHSSEPYAYAILASQRSKRCEQCFKSGATQSQTENTPESGAGDQQPLRRCTACKVAHYCSVDCQKQAWTYHKLECKSFRRVCPRIPTESVLLFLRLLQRHKHGDHKNVSEIIFDQKRVFTDLMHHAEAIKEDEKRIGEFIHLTTTLKAFVGESFQFPLPDELFEIFGRMVVNTFTICDGEMMPVGVGLYLGASILDHSCTPNAVITMEGVKLHLRSITDTDIATDKICVSYIDQLKLTKERRSELYQQYYFTCNCEMCCNKDMESLMQSIRCPQPNCHGSLLRDSSTHKCTMCDSAFPNGSDTITKYSTLVKSTVGTLEHLQELKDKKQCTEMLASVQTLLKQQEDVLPSMNIYRVKTLDKAMDAAIDTSNWKAAADYGLATMEAYRHYYHKYHPNVGVQLMKIGKLQLHEGQLEDAAISLEQAENILSLTHGTEHSLYRQLKTLLDQCSEERKVKLEITDA